jgi:hypothetical protein
MLSIHRVSGIYMTHSVSYCHFDELWVNGAYVCTHICMDVFVNGLKRGSRGQLCSSVPQFAWRGSEKVQET